MTKLSRPAISLALDRGLSFPENRWFGEAGFGILVHWDHASQQGIEIGWPLVGKSIIPGASSVEDVVTIDQYHSSAATFSPENWDARALARLARGSGAGYLVFTTRHHAGYSMFSSTFSNYSVEHSPLGRDITRELFDAVRGEGMRVGAYYSLPDWHHPEYPAVEQSDIPYGQRRRKSSSENWKKYQKYLRGQLTELLTNYGKVDLLWFDGDWERSPEEWDANGLATLCHSIQPGVIINDRLPGHGDYSTPEQGFPSQTHDGPWELCMTIGESWGWRPADTKIKSPVYILTTLCTVVSRGGKFLLNLSPRGDGSLPDVQVEILQAIGRWMERHSESVTSVQPTIGVDFPGPTTTRDGTLYLHLVMRPIEQIVVRGVPVARVKGVRVLETEEMLDYETSVPVHAEASKNSEPKGELRIQAPSETCAALDVIVVDFD